MRTFDWIVLAWLIYATLTLWEWRRVHDRELFNMWQGLANTRKRGFSIYQSVRSVYKAIGRELKKLKEGKQDDGDQERTD